MADRGGEDEGDDVVVRQAEERGIQETQGQAADATEAKLENRGQGQGVDEEKQEEAKDERREDAKEADKDEQDESLSRSRNNGDGGEKDEADDNADLEAMFDDEDDGAAPKASGGGAEEAPADQDKAEQKQGSPENKPSGPLHSDDEEDEDEQPETVAATSAGSTTTEEKGQASASAGATATTLGEESNTATAMDDSPDEPRTAETTANALFGNVSEDEDEEQGAGMRETEQPTMPSKQMDVTEDRPPPPERTPMSAPCGAGRVGKRVFLAKLPNFISIDPRGYDPDTFEAEEDQEGHKLMDDLGRRRVKLGAENTIHWRQVGDRLESNARLVKWSDGSVSLVLGDEVHDCVTTDLTSSGPVQQLLVKRDDGTGYEARAPFEQRLTFRATNLGSRTQQRLMHRAKSHSKAVRKTKTAVVSENPEKLKQQAIKEEQAAIRQRNKELRKRRKVTQLTESQLEMGMGMGMSINAIKEGSYDQDMEDEDEDEEDDDFFIEEAEEPERRERAPVRPQRRRFALSDDEDDE